MSILTDDYEKELEQIVKYLKEDLDSTEDEDKELILDDQESDETEDTENEELDSSTNDETSPDETEDSNSQNNEENDPKTELVSNLNRMLLLKRILEDVLYVKYNNELSALVNQIRQVLVILVDKITNNQIDEENVGIINSELKKLIVLSITFIKKKLGITGEENE